MSYITPNIRNEYLSSTSLISNITSSIVLVATSVLTDRLEGQAQLNMIITLRYCTFAVALLDVYCNQLPKEPEYAVSTSRPSLLDIFRLPLSNKKFALTMLIYGLYQCFMNIPGSVINTWLLEEVKTGFLYINVINCTYCIFIITTTKLWSRFIRKHGVFGTMAISLLLHCPTYLVYGLVNSGNYMWLMTAVRLVQHVISLSIALPVGSLIYVNLPSEDQTNYISFYSIVSNISTFLGMTIGTWVVAAMGDRTWSLFGYRMHSVPTLLMVQGVIIVGLAVFILLIQKKVRPAEEVTV